MIDVTNPNLSYEDFIAARDSNIMDIHKAIVEDIPLKTIQEHVFVNEILPIVTGEATNTDLAVLVAAVAGNPFLELNVTDASGTVLFTMPSLFERNVISQEESNKRGSIQSMLMTLDMVRRQSPSRAAKYLAHEFTNRGIATNKAALLSDRHVRWSAICARYGKVYSNTKVDKEGKVTNTTPTAVAIADNRKMEIDISGGDLF